MAFIRKFKSRQARLTYTFVGLLILLVIYSLLNWATQFNQYDFTKALVVIVIGAMATDYALTWMAQKLDLLK